MRKNPQKSKLVMFIYLLLCTLLLGNFNTSVAQTPGDEDPGSTSPQAATADYFVYLPIVVLPSPPVIPTFDLTVGYIEATQATQTLSNDVPMVAGRPTVLRVYTRTNDSIETTGLQVTIDAFRDGVRLPEAPLVIEDNTAKIWANANQLEALRDAKANSANFKLPAEWLSGQVTVTATVDADRSVFETDEGNNTLTMLLNFTSVPALDIVVVPIRYYYGGSYLFPPVTNFDFLPPGFMGIYPIHDVNISVHAPVNFSGDLYTTQGWSDLLDKVTSIRANEVGNGGPIVYYGVVPLDDGNRTTWYGGGIQGIGWIGVRASVGLTDLEDIGIDGDEIALHEVGHNFGRRHAPCSVNVDLDRNYPYDGGLIGQFGFNMNTFNVMSKTQRADIMGYCNRVWISDYNYKALYNKQRNFLTAIETTTQESLYVRVQLDPQAGATILPVYTLSAAPDSLPTSSEYQIELLNDQGNLVALHPAEILHTEEPGITAQAIHAILPRPQESFTRLRLVRNGQIAAEKRVSNATIAASLAPSIAQIQGAWRLTWGAPGAAALVRFTADGGQSWQVLDLDVLGGELELASEFLPPGTLQFEVQLADQLAPAFKLEWQNPATR
jgi:hypothetical protein